MQVTGSRGKKAPALQQGLGCGPRVVLIHCVWRGCRGSYPHPHLALLRGWKSGVPSGHGAPVAGGGHCSVGRGHPGGARLREKVGCCLQQPCLLPSPAPGWECECGFSWRAKWGVVSSGSHLLLHSGTLLAERMVHRPTEASLSLWAETHALG